MASRKKSRKQNAPRLEHPPFMRRSASSGKFATQYPGLIWAMNGDRDQHWGMVVREYLRAAASRRPEPVKTAAAGGGH